MSINAKDFPKIFGPYVLKQKFAGGGMAEIYLAESTGPGGFTKPLIIKTIHHAYLNDKRFVSMFTEEAKILSSLTHGNIVPIFDFGNVDDVMYLAMEFIEGVDTATLIDVCRGQGFPIALEAALYIGIGTAAGLSHAHQAKDSHGKSLNIVHRDISPHNILLSRGGEIKLCDFGLATRSIEDISTNIAASDEIKGKLKYLSPEQALGESVDRRSDLFSLGVVLYELIAGHHPVPSGAGVTVLRELAGGVGYPSLSSAAPWIPKDVCDIIDRALCFDKEKRFQTAQEMRSALSICLHRDYPRFSPEVLADLVIRAQSAVAETSGQDEKSSILSSRSAYSSSAVLSRASSPPPDLLADTAPKKPFRRVAALISAAVMLTVGVWLVARPAADSKAKRSVPVQAPPVVFKTSAPQDTSNQTETEKLVATVAIVDTADTSQAPRDTDSEQAPPATKTAASSRHAEKRTETGKEASSKKNKSFGVVNINAAPWADVAIDGDDYTTTPLLGIKLRAGRHKAVLKNSALGITKTRVFTVKPDETVTVVVEMQPAPLEQGTDPS
jgi:serine/threonine protein kinase